MEPIGKTVSEHWELFTFLWGAVIFSVSAVSSWASARAGATFALKSHDAKIKENSDRIKVLEDNFAAVPKEDRLKILEDKISKTMTDEKCRIYRQDCKDDIDDDGCGIEKRLDTITKMFSELEDRRTKRWEDFERRREASKDALQKTFEGLIKKITRLETIIQERSKVFRKINGLENVEYFDPDETDSSDTNRGFSNAVYP